ncbi:hypothetical protein BEWA_027100 [Theileria equi strain WA]|uniref:Uncharacterized protein n=1 Tax=Theileria equi strain WA TaxID=1537102 RepID=L0AXW2_THEEQ|nr:hypothetical protein BEWA_027100 [Theileria equi strain WA]AFZ79861.1 hypothetical protein BEWA_027100 [Theileria equi strain WA]|eukprot:XP_004829527.1 hypothetical protein BEWA_027100 [Theileria equi strain WA]
MAVRTWWDRKVHHDSNEKKYYYENKNGKIFLELKTLDTIPGYRTITHYKKDGKITEIKKDGKILEGFGNLSASRITAYYWTGDYLYKTPPIIQLNDDYDFYVFEKDNKWKKDDSILYANLRETLERQNCKRNKAHHVNMKRKKFPKKYKCLTKGCGVEIEEIFTPYQDYAQSLHKISDGSLTRFNESIFEQYGLPSFESVKEVYVFFYPKGSGTPFLMYFKDLEKWYRRNDNDLTKWYEMMDDYKPKGDGKDKEILKSFFAKYIPRITIDADYYNEGEKTYKADSHTITVTKKTIGKDFYQFTHSGGDNKPFLIKDVLKNGKEQGVKLDDTLTSLSFFYLGEDPKGKDYLLAETLKHRSSSRYIYYSSLIPPKFPYAVAIKSVTRPQDSEIISKLKQAIEETEKTKFSEQDIAETVTTSVKATLWTMFGSALGYGGWKTFIALLPLL